MTTQATVVADIETVLTKLAADLDKVRSVSDKVNTEIQKVDSEFLVKVIPGLEPIATVVADISAGLASAIDALDTIADGLASLKAASPTAP
jgi:capsule polysaccharide export protein KpsE/RkpR